MQKIRFRGFHGRTFMYVQVVVAFWQAPAIAAASRESIELHSGWRFAKGENERASESDYDDSAWTTVRVPHDWAIAGPFDPTESGYAAKLPWRGVGWYRRTFSLDSRPGTRVYLDFDGVMAFPKVFINGKLAGEWDYGYTSFRIDATPLVNLKGPNVIAVRVDTTKHGTRWYPGAGIYRKVTLQICKPIHLAHWGSMVSTPAITTGAATVRVRTKVENHSDKAAAVGVVCRFRGPSGAKIAEVADALTIPASDAKEIELTTSVPNPQLWDVAAPNLYSVETAIVSGKIQHPKESDASTIIDRETTSFGIRTCTFTADDGFHLNGRRLQLHGVCLHHDQGPLGAAFYTRAMERQLQIMREMGVNAIRTSHNPPAPELLDLCDRMGFVVWDECFDKWDDKADRMNGNPPLREHAERHLRSLVMRDRNHPSVVVWSIANEIKAIGGSNGYTKDRIAMMREVVRKYDDTRAVGLAHHIPETGSTDIFDPLDVVGWNYGRRYAIFRERHPDKPIIYSESASSLSTRGFYELPLPATKTDYSDQHQVDSYEFNAAPWSDIPDVEFKRMQDDRFVAGEFVWTGFDYLGEPTPFTSEAKNSYFGIVDLCGIPKDRYYLYRSSWRPDTPTVHILPHWNWTGHEGQKVPVFVYTNGDSAELFLNGRSLGIRRKGDVPKRPANLASGRTASASTSLPDHTSQLAADENGATYWSPQPEDQAPSWQIDLGKTQAVKSLMVGFERDIKNISYVVKASTDSVHWSIIVPKQATTDSLRGRSRDVVHDIDVKARFVRVEMTFSGAGERNGIRTFEAYAEPCQHSYYAPTYDYRLRWNDVEYKPGELKAVAYKQGRKIGSEVVRTAGAPAALRLTPDRVKLAATGEDLCYVLVEACDKEGNLCPLADNLVRFHVEGPCEIAGVGNGNPLSLEPFLAESRKLFFGKAMLIVRTAEERTGQIQIVATSDGLVAGKASCQAMRPSP